MGRLDGLNSPFHQVLVGASNMPSTEMTGSRFSLGPVIADITGDICLGRG